MSETLIIAGETFESVAGFKALDSLNVIQTYIKPSGTKEISVMSNGIITENINVYASAQINVAVPNTYAAGDEGKVVSNGALIIQGSAEYSTNGTYNTTLVSRIDIAVSGGSPTGTININNNGVYNVSTYASASVLVPNSYNIEDEGKVVSSGALVAQSSATYSSNGSYDTTLVSSIEIEVPSVEPSGTISISSNGEYDVAAYASASVNISGGGGYTAEDFGDVTKPSGDIIYLGSYIGLLNDNSSPGYFTYRKNITKFYAPNYNTTANNTVFKNMTSMKYIILPSCKKFYNSTFQSCSNLLAIDWCGSTCHGSSFHFYYCTKLAIMVIRSGNNPTLGASNAFQNTPFASGKSGGTLYVPNAMITTYQNTTNWSTYLSYPNNSILPLEGSYYENHFVDGTELTETVNVIYNLTHCTSENTMTTVYKPNYLVTFLTADSGYEISSVVVTVNGVDVTSTAYNSTTNKVNAPSTGNIVITATAIAS